MEHIALELENGSRLSFDGRLFAEAVWEDEEKATLRHHKLYVTDTNSQVYAIFKERGGRRSVYAYRLSVKEGRCAIFDGKATCRMTMNHLLLLMKRHFGDNGAMLEQAREMLLSASC